jgi:hypothetical protein
MNEADQFALMGYAVMLPIVAAIVWAWWQDWKDDYHKDDEDG